MQGRRFNDNNNRDFARTPPVRVGDELDVKIEAVGEKGDGVAKKDGFVLFVPNVKEGDNVRIKVSRVLRKVGFADVIGKSDSPAQEEEQEAEPQEAEPEFDESNDSEDFGDDSDNGSDDSEEDFEDEENK